MTNMTKEEKLYLDHLKKEDKANLENFLTRLNILFACDTTLKDIRVVDITADNTVCDNMNALIQINYGKDYCQRINVTGNSAKATLFTIISAIYNDRCAGMYYRGPIDGGKRNEQQ